LLKLGKNIDELEPDTFFSQDHTRIRVSLGTIHGIGFIFSSWQYIDPDPFFLLAIHGSGLIFPPNNTWIRIHFISLQYMDPE